jgi:hypothetical protein
LRKEQSLLTKKEVDKKDWRIIMIKFMEKHQYRTDYCRLQLGDQKAKIS